MKRFHASLAVLWIGMLCIAGCGKSPTDPGGGGGGGGGGGNGQPSQLDLSGAWSGTITDRMGSCQPERFSVNLTQTTENAHGFNGPKLTGSFSTACGGAFPLQLFVNGNHLIGTIAGKGHVDGTVGGSSLEFAIISGQGGLENGQVIVAEVAMSR